jgi:hypothetical protein
MTYDEIVQGLRDSSYELQNEGRLVRAGLKVDQDTASIAERYAWLYSDDALDAVGEPTTEEGERVRSALLQGILERRTAAQEDRLATFYAKSTVAAGDERVPFYTALARLSVEPDAARREALDDGANAVIAEAEELELAVEATTEEVIRSFGMGGTTEFWSRLKKVDYGALCDELVRVADAAEERYRAWVEPRMAAIDRAYGDCPRAHLVWFRSIPEHASAFTVEGFEPAMRRTFERLGLELFTAPTIHIDLADRPAKNPRASVFVPDAGREVHLLVRPTGGHSDYAAFLHEAGHALHFGLTDPTIGWPLANSGRSMAYAELWSYLVERIGHDPAWLTEMLGLDDAAAERIATDLAGVDLMMFMRYVGKLLSELEIYAGDPLDAARGQAIYARVATGRSGFRYDPRTWQFDRDGGFYSADYLRAWLAEASLDRALRERFGERWWAGREAGAWLREQWKRGWAPEAEETVAEVGGRPWSGDALLQRLDRWLPGGRVGAEVG